MAVSTQHVNSPTGIVFVIHPGLVRSRSDGQTHVITAEQLMKLYRVTPRHCVIARPGEFVRAAGYAHLIHLWPREDGNYALKYGHFRMAKVKR